MRGIEAENNAGRHNPTEEQDDDLPFVPEKRVVNVIQAYTAALGAMWLVLHIISFQPARDQCRKARKSGPMSIQHGADHPGETQWHRPKEPIVPAGGLIRVREKPVLAQIIFKIFDWPLLSAPPKFKAAQALIGK